MNVRTQTAPHLLSLYLDGSDVHFAVQCPHDDIDRPCAGGVECDHLIPEEPDVDAPDFRRGPDGKLVKENGHYLYVEDADPEAVRLWSAFDVELEAWEEEHLDNGYHVENSCWVTTWVNCEQRGDGWELVDFDDTLVEGPVPVAWENRNSTDDPYLELSPWKE